MVVGAALTAVGGPPDKETLRLEARRQREQERTKKLGPGRLRNIGADIAGVKNQIDDKKRQDDADRDAQRRCDEEDAAIRRYLIQVESEDALAKRKEMVTLRNDWHLQTSERAEQRDKDAKERAIPIDPETCAPGAGQKFNGEDPMRLERTRLQALQLKQWTLRTLEEKRQQKALDAKDEAQYAEYLAEIERLQQSLHNATEQERARIASELQRFNQFLLQQKREAEKKRHDDEQSQNANEITYSLHSNLVSENPLQAQLPGGVPLDHRVRCDHWKGFSQEQTKQYLAQNDLLLAEKARHHEQTRADDACDARRQAELHRQLVEDEYMAQKHKAALELAIKRDRDAQAKENADREHKNAQQARGKIEPTFFQNFGRSYR